MLAATEFTVGSLADVKPLSLVLPRTKHEATILVGSVDGGPVAAFLDSSFRFGCFPSSENQSWRGLIVPNVIVEVDEASIFDPQSTSPRLGNVVRTATQLAVCAKADGAFGRLIKVVLVDGLPLAGSDQSAGFSRWRIVIGTGPNKRTLIDVDSQDKPATAS